MNTERELVPVAWTGQRVILVDTGTWWSDKAEIDYRMAHGGALPPRHSYIARTEMSPRLYARLYGRPW